MNGKTNSHDEIMEATDFDYQCKLANEYANRFWQPRQHGDDGHMAGKTARAKRYRQYRSQTARQGVVNLLATHIIKTLHDERGRDTAPWMAYGFSDNQLQRCAEQRLARYTGPMKIANNGKALYQINRAMLDWYLMASDKQWRLACCKAQKQAHRILSI